MPRVLLELFHVEKLRATATEGYHVASSCENGSELSRATSMSEVAESAEL
jgi:hypothetical protein